MLENHQLGGREERRASDECLVSHSNSKRVQQALGRATSNPPTGQRPVLDIEPAACRITISPRVLVIMPLSQRNRRVTGMRLRENCALVLLALSGLLGLWPAGTLAQEATAGSQIKATYRVDLSALNLGEFNLTASLKGSAYEVRAKGRFSLLA